MDAPVAGRVRKPTSACASTAVVHRDEPRPARPASGSRAMVQPFGVGTISPAQPYRAPIRGRHNHGDSVLRPRVANAQISDFDQIVADTCRQVVRPTGHRAPPIEGDLIQLKWFVDECAGSREVWWYAKVLSRSEEGTAIIVYTADHRTTDASSLKNVELGRCPYPLEEVEVRFLNDKAFHVEYTNDAPTPWRPAKISERRESGTPPLGAGALPHAFDGQAALQLAAKLAEVEADLKHLKECFLGEPPPRQATVDRQGRARSRARTLLQTLVRSELADLLHDNKREPRGFNKTINGDLGNTDGRHVASQSSLTTRGVNATFSEFAEIRILLEEDGMNGSVRRVGAVQCHPSDIAFFFPDFNRLADVSIRFESATDLYDAIGVDERSRPILVGKPSADNISVVGTTFWHNSVRRIFPGRSPFVFLDTPEHPVYGKASVQTDAPQMKQIVSFVQDKTAISENAMSTSVFVDDYMSSSDLEKLIGDSPSARGSNGAWRHGHHGAGKEHSPDWNEYFGPHSYFSLRWTPSKRAIPRGNIFAPDQLPGLIHVVLPIAIVRTHHLAQCVGALLGDGQSDAGETDTNAIMKRLRLIRRPV